MKIMNFKKVATSTNDADGKGTFIPADSILAIRQTTANDVLVLLKAVAGTGNNAPSKQLAKRKRLATSLLKECMVTCKKER